jgi:hypothetical protein
MPLALFKAGEHRLLVAAVEIDDAISLQAGLRQRRREKVRPRDALKHLAARAGGDPGSEERRRGTVDGAVSAAGNLMRRTLCEPAAGKA